MLVGGFNPSKKIWKSVGMMKFPIWKVKKVMFQNHQPVCYFLGFTCNSTLIHLDFLTRWIPWTAWALLQGTEVLQMAPFTVCLSSWMSWNVMKDKDVSCHKDLLWALGGESWKYPYLELVQFDDIDASPIEILIFDNGWIDCHEEPFICGNWICQRYFDPTQNNAIPCNLSPSLSSLAWLLPDTLLGKSKKMESSPSLEGKQNKSKYENLAIPSQVNGTHTTARNSFLQLKQSPVCKGHQKNDPLPSGKLT